MQLLSEFMSTRLVGTVFSMCIIQTKTKHGAPMQFVYQLQELCIAAAVCSVGQILVSELEDS